MADYIDREALIERLTRNLNACNPGTFSERCYQDAINTVTFFPAADVATVRHGYWDGISESCSVCGKHWASGMVNNAQDWGYFDPMPDYCPYCGAKMDLEV